MHKVTHIGTRELTTGEIQSVNGGLSMDDLIWGSGDQFNNGGTTISNNRDGSITICSETANDSIVCFTHEPSAPAPVQEPAPLMSPAVCGAIYGAGAGLMTVLAPTVVGAGFGAATVLAGAIACD
ncbi:MAG TPA: hypothetical protein VED40_02560 [Azospirillaceae bacterium]|nr:hypothetical protein [Azospirillaceae bacterium]